MDVRTKSFLALGVTLLVGIVIGSLLTARANHERWERLSRLRTTEGFVARMEENIGEQEASQRARTRPVLEATAQQMHRVDQRCGEQRKQAIDSMRSQLEPLLTPTQRARLNEHFERMRRRLPPRQESQKP